jgi:hypothetical protein
MRLKTLALALLLASGSAAAQHVTYANVIHVSETQHVQTVGHNIQTVCRNQSQPIYSNVPVYGHGYHPYHVREQPWLRTLAGVLIGAHIGGSGDARVAGALIGGAVAHGTSMPYGYHQPHVVGYAPQIVGYQNYPVCENVQVPVQSVERRFIVHYEINGHRNTVILPYHPGNTLAVPVVPQFR